MSIRLPYETSHQLPGQTMVSWRSLRPSPPEKALPGEGTKISTDPLEQKDCMPTQEDFKWPSVWCGSSNPGSCMFIAIISWVARSGVNLLQSIQSVKFPARTPLYGQRLWIVLRCHLLQSIQHVHRKWNWTCPLSRCFVVATVKAKSFDAPFPYSITFEGGLIYFLFFLSDGPRIFCSFLKQTLFMHLPLCHVQEK